MIRLRGHHLLCVLTYVGEGYSPGFVAGYDQVVRRLEAGEAVTLVEGPDDLCAPLLTDPGKPAHCWDEGVRRRDLAARQSVATALDLPADALRPGTCLVLDATWVGSLRQAVRRGRTAAACAGCEWLGLCREVAGREFAGARLHPPPAA